MEKIAILLTVHNRKEQTLNCLTRLVSVINKSKQIIEIYLTDDGCTDGTHEAVKQKFPYVHIVLGDGTLFWNRGMYKAWSEASKKGYDYYLWLNDDTYVYEDFLSVLLNESSAKNNQSIIVGCTHSQVGKIITYGGRINGHLICPNGNTMQVDYFNGNIVLVPLYVFERVGNLDYYYRHSKGDFDYGLRAKKLGIKSYQVGKFLGECDWHEKIDKWCDPEISLCERWKAMKRPTGMPPKEIYHLNLNHRGFVSAVIHYVLVYLRCLFPKVWNLKKQINKFHIS